MTSQPSSPTDRRTPIAAVIVLAAGGGTRMKSRTPKMLHTIAGRTLVSRVISAAEALQPDRFVVVVGHQRELVLEHLAEVAPEVTTVVQAEQLGSGHAVQVALDAMGELSGDVVVLSCDTPLLTGEALQGLVGHHIERHDKVTLLSSRVPDPTGYGRVVRDDRGEVTAIVEHRDADLATRAIDEINASIWVFDAGVLASGLSRLTPDNAQSELYLTDVLSLAHGDGHRVDAWLLDDAWQAEGVNDRVQLSRIGVELNRRIGERWMRAGVTIIDPSTTWIGDDVTLAEDVTLLPGTSLEGATSVAAGSTIGPDTTLVDCEVGEDATVVRTHAELAVIGAEATVGPFAYLRPGTQLGVRSKVGTFVEIKNARLGEGAKAPHLSYVGDATIGADANIGAGVIFANYDGLVKSRTEVGEASFIGSDSVLVAPVYVGDGAYVAAGSTVTADVAAGQLAVGRARQRTIDGWVQRKRAGTKTAAAAERALGQRTQPEPS